VNQFVEECEQRKLNGGSFDVEAAIADLLIDAGCHSLELPTYLSPQQRSQAKLLAGQHSELKCESYGFGSDRRLHVFKKSATTCIRVKNTFVDGWNGDENESDAIIFRSMPGNMPGQRRCEEHAPLYSVERAGRQLELSPLCTKPAASSARSRPDSLPQGIDEPATPSTAPSSSPTGLARPASPHSSVRSVEETPLVPPGVFNTVSSGTMVVIQGLVKAPAFNGRLGKVHSFNAEDGRYDVLLANPPADKALTRWAKVKYENLKLVGGGTPLDRT